MAQEAVRAQAGQQGWPVTGSHSGCVGSAWREGEKAMDKPMEGNRVGVYNVGPEHQQCQVLFVTERWSFPSLLPACLSCAVPSHPILGG